MYAMGMQFTLSRYMISTSREYLDSLMGKRVAFITPAGTRVVGTITQRPMSTSRVDLAVTTDSGKWAALGWDDTVEMLDA